MVKTRMISIADLHQDPSNVRKHSVANIMAISESLEKFGQRKPLVVQGSRIIAGNGTYQAAQALGWLEISVTDIPDDWTHSMAQAYAIADNQTATLAEWDMAALADQLLELEEAEIDMSAFGFDDVLPLQESALLPPTLAERFLIPPLSIFDQRQGAWTERKRQWMSLGIESEIGREGGVTLPSLSGRVPDYYAQKNAKENTLGHALTNEEFESDHLVISESGGLSSSGTSVFDPVLCEIAYRWWSPLQGQILDPFAGGSVRGVMAAALDRQYTGIDLRAEQIQANREQWASIESHLSQPASQPRWIAGDSLDLDSHLDPEYQADMLFSCPPYADLEIYSDDPADLSTMSYPEFMEAYRKIIRGSVARLKENRFAVWVVGDVRDPKSNGCYRGLIHETVRAFEDAGAHLYNEAILVSPVGSLAVRVSRMFTSSRKLGKTHQQVLIFVKGNPKKATEACGAVEVEPVPIEESDLTQ